MNFGWLIVARDYNGKGKKLVGRPRKEVTELEANECNRRKKAKPAGSMGVSGTHTRPGRTPTPIDLATVHNLASIGCTEIEIAHAFGLGEDAWFKRRKSDPRIDKVVAEGRSGGRVTLRRMQWGNAEQGNTQMQIWLGKQMLDQRDKQATELSGPGGGPIRVRAEEMTDDQLARIAAQAQEEE